MLKPEPGTEDVNLGEYAQKHRELKGKTDEAFDDLGKSAIMATRALLDDEETLDITEKEKDSLLQTIEKKLDKVDSSAEASQIKSNEAVMNVFYQFLKTSKPRSEPEASR